MPSIGLVGCGKWGRLILRDLLSLGATVSVVAFGESASHAAGAGASAVVANVGDLPSVEGIVVASPTATHADVIEALLPRGVPIYCEKPLCDDDVKARRLATAAPTRLFVMDKWRYHCGVLEMAAIARSGELGPVIGLRTTRIQYSHPHANTDCVWTCCRTISASQPRFLVGRCRRGGRSPTEPTGCCLACRRCHRTRAAFGTSLKSACERRDSSARSRSCAGTAPPSCRMATPTIS